MFAEGKLCLMTASIGVVAFCKNFIKYLGNHNKFFIHFAFQISLSVSIGPGYIQPKHRRSDIFIEP